MSDFTTADRAELAATRQHAALAEKHAFDSMNLARAARDAARSARDDAALTLALLRQLVAGGVEIDVQALGQATATSLAPLLSLLPDEDIERIRDAAVEALELSKGTITDGVVRFSRVAQG